MCLYRFLKRNNNPAKTWKIFGKVAVPVIESNTTSSLSTTSSTSSSVASSPNSSPGLLRKLAKKETVGSSTTALIFENRPGHLPPKSAKEELKHRQQYDEMIMFAKRKEVKDQETEKKKLKERQKLDKQISNIVKTWKEDVIPNWHSR